MLHTTRSVLLVIIFMLFIPRLYAQYCNADSLVLLPGVAHPVTLNEFDTMMQEMHAEDLRAGQEFFYGQYIPAGNLLRHFAVPSNGKVISRFGMRSGRMHTGTDIKMSRGDTIYAAFKGRVVRAKYYYGYGNMVVIDHGNNLETCYAHLSAFLADQGEIIEKMQPVGLAGSTGRASTSHLHFEIKEGGKYFDPELVYDFNTGSIREAVYSVRQLAELQQDKNPGVHLSGEESSQRYIVAQGDSLWKIARRFQTSIKSLCQLNNLNENSVLNVGTVLKLF